jgi:hypothetical protein
MRQANVFHCFSKKKVHSPLVAVESETAVEEHSGFEATAVLSASSESSAGSATASSAQKRSQPRIVVALEAVFRKKGCCGVRGYYE